MTYSDIAIGAGFSGIGAAIQLKRAGRHDLVITATGPLSEPSTPDIPGLESFSGAMFHSARWRHD